LLSKSVNTKTLHFIGEMGPKRDPRSEPARQTHINLLHQCIMHDLQTQSSDSDDEHEQAATTDDSQPNKKMNDRKFVHIKRLDDPIKLELLFEMYHSEKQISQTQLLAFFDNEISNQKPIFTIWLDILLKKGILGNAGHGFRIKKWRRQDTAGENKLLLTLFDEFLEDELENLQIWCNEHARFAIAAVEKCPRTEKQHAHIYVEALQAGELKWVRSL
jgi:hypothetical protein